MVYSLIPSSEIPSKMNAIGRNAQRASDSPGKSKSNQGLRWPFRSGVHTSEHIQMLAAATDLDSEMFQLDVQTAFLNGDVEEEVCVTMTPG